MSRMLRPALGCVFLIGMAQTAPAQKPETSDQAATDALNRAILTRQSKVDDANLSAKQDYRDRVEAVAAENARRQAEYERRMAAWRAAVAACNAGDTSECVGSPK